MELRETLAQQQKRLQALQEPFKGLSKDQVAGLIRQAVKLRQENEQEIKERFKAKREQHDAACKCAVARADWKSYAAVELAMLQEQDASLELNRLWNETRRMETQCKLPAMPRYAF